MKAELSELRARVGRVVRQSFSGDVLLDVSVEPAAYDDESDFLRVKVRLKDLPDIPLARLEGLITAIEDDLRDFDERFPSVRFPESAAV